MKTLISVSFLLFAISLKAQTDCPPGFDIRQPLSDRTNVYFNIQGVPIARYNWSNKDLNCNINQFNHHGKRQGLYKIGAITGITLGATLMSFVYLAPAPLASTGTIFLAGGATCLGFSIKERKKKTVHFNAIMSEYQMNPW